MEDLLVELQDIQEEKLKTVLIQEKYVEIMELVELLVKEVLQKLITVQTKEI